MKNIYYNKNKIVEQVTSVLIILLLLISCSNTSKDVEVNTNEQSSNISKSEVPDTVKDTYYDISLSFAGDMMIAAYKDESKPNNFNDYARRYSSDYFLSAVSEIFKNDDFTLVNLENVLSDRDLEPVQKNHTPAYWYKSSTSNIDILKYSGIEAVSLSNNHTNDYGKQGYDDTINTIVSNSLYYATDDKIIYFEKYGFRIAFICHGLWAEGQAEQISNLVKITEKQSDYQIVYFHGGRMKIHEPEEWKKRACHRIADAGADLILGSHPHVLQPMEVYNSVPILYSLGNFCYGGSRKPENRTIIYQHQITIRDDAEIVKEESVIIPCYVYGGSINNFQPHLITDITDKQKVIDFLYGKIDSPV